MGFELDIEFLFGKSHCLAVDYALEGINWLVRDLVLSRADAKRIIWMEDS